MKQDLKSKAEDIVRLVEDAGKLVVLCSNEASKKSDGTDITPADIQSHIFLTAGIKKLFGNNAKILSEEETPENEICTGTAFVIDPLDGTTNFSKGKRNFSVLLGVLQDGVPVFGAAYAPAYGITVCGGTLIGRSELRQGNKNTGVSGYKSIIPLSNHDVPHAAIVPRRFINPIPTEDNNDIKNIVDFFKAVSDDLKCKGSSSVIGSALPIYKGDIGFKLYSAGNNPKLRSGDWDLAAWDAVLRGGGGIMTAQDGKPIEYGNAENGFKHSGFICWRSKETAAEYLKFRESKM